MSYTRRVWSAHSTSTPAMAGGNRRLGTGPGEDREPTGEDGAETVTRWTEEWSPGGEPGVEPWRRAGNGGPGYHRPKERPGGRWDLPEVEGTRLGRESAYQI
jgi:hypothetical protein